MKRIRGVSEIQFGLYLGAFVLVCAAAWGLHTWWTDYTESLREEGRNEVRVQWNAQRLQDQARFDAERNRLIAEKNAALAELQGQLTTAQKKYEEERGKHDAEKTRNADVARAIRDGRLVYIDPNATAGTGGDCRGTAGAGAVAGGHAPTQQGGGRLSAGTAEFLWSEASRADELVDDLIEQLTLAQDTARAYYLIAKDRCRK